MSDWDMGDLATGELWVEKVMPSCPYCGGEVDVDPDESCFAVSVRCDACGFSCVATPPDEISPLKGVIKEIRL